MKKIYAYSHEIFNIILLIGLTIILSYLSYISKEYFIFVFGIVLFIFAIVFGLLSIAITYKFIKKICKKEEIIVKKKGLKEIVSRLFFHFVVTMNVWLSSLSLDLQYKFISYEKPRNFAIITYFFFVYVVIDVIFIILNVFLGTRIIEEENN